MGKEFLKPQNAEIKIFVKDTPLHNWKQIWIKLQPHDPKENKIKSSYQVEM